VIIVSPLLTFYADIDDCFVESKAFQLDNICCLLEMALTVIMAHGTLKDNQKILVVRLAALNFYLPQSV